MSTGLELIPFAIAAGVGAIGRYRARRAEREVLGASPYSFETRMRGRSLSSRMRQPVFEFSEQPPRCRAC